MKILFVNANLHGHINPTIGLVKKLTNRGNQVSYFCSEQFNELVTKAGANWVGYNEKLALFLKEYRPTDRHPFYILMEYILQYDEVMLQPVLNIAQDNPYDLIICDSIFGGAYFLKQILKMPVVCSHSSFAMSQAPVPKHMLVPGYHPQLDHCYQILNRLCEKYEIETPSLEQLFVSKGDKNIVYTTSAFNGDDAVNNPDYLFAGPSIERPQDEVSIDIAATGSKKLIYISLGSLNTNHLNFYKTCILAFRDSDYTICMSVGDKCDVAQLGEIPANFIIKRYFPQLEILKRADAFITHAGFNSVNEALYYGVPMLAFPMVNDQHKVAKHLVALNLGLSESLQEISPEFLRTKMETLLLDKQIKENCLQISKEMNNSGMLEQAVDELEKYIKICKARQV